MMNKSMVFLAKRDLEVNKRRYRLVKLSIAVSVLLMVLVLLLSNSFYNKMVAEMAIANKDAVTIGFGNSENSLNYKGMPLFSDQDIKHAKEVKNVKDIAGVKFLFADDIKFQNGKTSISNGIHCLGEEYFKNFSIKIGRGQFPEKDNEMLIGNAVHKATSQDVGDTVRIKIKNEYVTFIISGVIDEQKEQAFSTLPTEINQMIAININNKMVSSDKYYYLNGVLKNGANLREVAHDIERSISKNNSLQQSLSGTGLSVVAATQQDVVDMLARWFSYIDLFIALMIVLISVVAMVNIVNIFAMTIQENHKQIATYKIVGAVDKQVENIYLFESLIMGVKGTVIGLVLGCASSWLVIFLTGLPLDVAFIRLGFPVLAGIITTVLAGVFVTRKIAKIDVEEVLNQ